MHEQKNSNKETPTIKKKFLIKNKTPEILEGKNTIFELKNSTDSFKSRLNHTEERISNLDDRTLGKYPVRGAKKKKE